MTKDWQDAIRVGDAVRVRSLLEAGADINSLDRYGQTALMSAAHKGYPEVVRLLAQCGADLNHTAKFELSALMLAVIADHLTLFARWLTPVPTSRFEAIQTLLLPATRPHWSSRSR